ncbi:GcrA family cell cycle regulator [Bradyrhizobium sp. RT5a]|uniref:GcrA family cell cycle regulator n=1 Tax=unclassified Bradyrhizobium TaxID=2631580 RepID=UPI0033941919
MGWDAKDIALLNRLWSAGQSAAQIAHRLGCSRNAVCGMLTRLGLSAATSRPQQRPR